MAAQQLREIESIRCRHVWVVDLRTLGQPDRVIYKDGEQRRVAVFRLLCPNCHTPNVLEEPEDGAHG